MIGCQTKKCVGYSVRSKCCKVCEVAQHTGKAAKEHDCRKNWDGSAKAMEADMVVEMVKTAKEKDVIVGTMVGDEDSTSISRARKEVSVDIQKRSDSNHVKMILFNSLYSLQKKHKQLSVKVIKYLQKCFSYMVLQNKGDASGIRKGLMALSLHPFDDHSNCDEKWWRFLNEPSSKFQSLPYGRPLSGEILQADILQIFEKFEEQAEKLRDLKSSQANESLNNTVASKAHKSAHYSGSESLSF